MAAIPKTGLATLRQSAITGEVRAADLARTDSEFVVSVSDIRYDILNNMYEDYLLRRNFELWRQHE